jgi:uncharacterized protein YdhG (YjbR/CyaY superfamily)
MAASSGSRGTVADVEAYLARVPDAMRPAVEVLRETIRAAAPDAEEGISYGAPAFRYHGRPLVAYGAAKAHYAFYVMDPAVLEAHADELTGLDTSKGTIRFKAGSAFPADLVTRLVEDRVRGMDAR